jgi:L-fuconolactonase
LRIDAHHSFSEQYPLQHLGTILERNRFEGSVLVTSQIPPEIPDFVRAVVIRTDSIPAGALDEYQRCPKFRGVCLSLAPDRLNSLAELERRDLTLDVSGGIGWLKQVVECFPRLRIVVDDLGTVPSLPDGVLAKLTRPVPNALAVYGPDRLMFGSDWPTRLPEITWKASLAAFTQSIGAQPIEVREEILGGTAARFYRI